VFVKNFRFKPKLATVNSYLSVVLVILAAYIIVLPFLPNITWSIKHDIPLVSSKPVQLAESLQQVDGQNTLYIPSIDLKQQIYQGASPYTVNKGVWLRPNTSTPDKGGNSVMVGHRFTYSGKSVFYYLDKVKLGDEIVVFWSGQKYVYKVEQIKTVGPNAGEVEAATSQDVLTLYTCTPLLTAKDRLVVVGRLQK